MHMCKFIFFFSLLLASHINAQDLYDLNRVQDVRLKIEKDNWDKSLDAKKQMETKERILGSIQINSTKLDSVGIRYKGNSSYHNVKKSESSKLPFNIKVNQVIKGQRIQKKYKTLKLSNVFRDPSFLREVLSYEIAGKYMPAPRANFARLYVNDQFLGLYNNTQSVDDHFLESHFGTSSGILVKCDPTSWDATKENKGNRCQKGDKASLMYLGKDSSCYSNLYEMKSDYGWKELIRLTKILNKETDKIGSILNVDQALWMLAFNNLVVNLDSYNGRLCHNYYLYQDTFGIFQPILWDMNLSFGGFRFLGQGKPMTDKQMMELSPFAHYTEKNSKRPLIVQLLNDGLNRKVYIAHMKTMLKDFFNNNEYEKKALAIQRNIDSYVKMDENKLYPYENFKANFNTTAAAGKTKIIGIKELMAGRAAYLNNHPLFKKEAPVISEVKHSVQDSIVHISCRISNGTSAFVYYREKEHAPFKRIKLNDKGEKGDKTADDNIFSLDIETTKPEYYILSLNADAAMLNPEQASKEFYKVK